MGERAVEPGRYAQRPDGSWQIFTDKAELGFVPVACVTVKRREFPVERDAPIMLAPDVAIDPAPLVERAVVTVQRADGGHFDFMGQPEAIEAATAVAKAARAKVKAEPRAQQSKAAPPAWRTAFAKHDRMIAAKRAAEPEAMRTATPGDVFRAVADQFGILPAVGARVSTARFKPFVHRDEDASASAAYERAIEEAQAKR